MKIGLIVRINSLSEIGLSLYCDRAIEKRLTDDNNSVRFIGLEISAQRKTSSSLHYDRHLQRH